MKYGIEWFEATDPEENKEFLKKMEERFNHELLGGKHWFFEELMGQEESAINTSDLKKMTGGVNQFWGVRMPIMAAEESGEVLKAISKLERFLYAHFEDYDDATCWDIHVHTDRDDYDSLVNDLTKEMADLMIAMGALMNRYGVDPYNVDAAIKDKLSKERTV